MYARDTTSHLRRLLFAAALAPWLAWAQPSQTVSFSPSAATFADTVTITLSGAADGQQIRYVLAAGAGASAAEVTRDSPVYEQPLVITDTALVRAAVFDGEGQGGRATSGHYLKVGPDLAAFSSKLPVMVLDDLGAGPLEKDEINHPSWVFGFTPRATPTFARAADFNSALVASVRGSSSADFPKKGFNIRMRDAAYRSRALALFDLPAYERWALVAPWAFDHTYINNVFVYELSNRIGRWAPRTRLAEVFFNAEGDTLTMDDHHGIYVVTDRIRIESGRVAVAKLGSSDAAEPEITGGYILKIDPPDPGDVSWRTNRGVPAEDPSELVLVEPGGDDITPAQLEYIQGYVQEMEDALHADHAAEFAQRTHLQYIDRASWVDHHILNVLASNPDALIRSAYFTKPRGGRLQAGPVWDFDRALGGFWDERTDVLTSWSGENGNVDVWRAGWWGLLADDPEFVQAWVDRWQSLRRGELGTAAMTRLVDTLSANAGPAAAGRDAERWPDNEPPQGSYAAQVAHLKSWLTQRAEWIDAQFVAAPEVSVAGGLVTYTPAPGAMLVYAADGADPRGAGGTVASWAHLHAGALTLPVGVEVRVRSYDPTPHERFPSSAWSSAVGPVRGGATGTTGGRVVNLSTRAHLAAGEQLVIGFVVAEAAAKPYLLRAVGPGLAAFGETSTLNDPELVVTSMDGTVLVRNAGWLADAASAQLPSVAQSVGAFPLAAGGGDAATVRDFPAGNFLLQIHPAGSGAGTVLGEIYEVSGNGRTANVSIRGRTSADAPLTGGFVVAGGASRLLVRAIGPTLQGFGVADAIEGAVLTVRSGTSVLATNERWADSANVAAIASATSEAGAFALEASAGDAAVLATLPAGAYTVEVRPKTAAGAVLLEVYQLR